MKIKTLLGCALIATLMVAIPSEAIAQKKATGKKTTASRTATAKKNAGPALNEAKLVDTRYFAAQIVDQNNSCLLQWITLKADNVALFDLIESKVEFTWKVSGNTLTFSRGGNVAFTMTSTNGGKTFTGKSQGQSVTFYDISNSHGSEFTAAGVEKGLLAGNYYTYLGFQPKKGAYEAGFPVTVKFVEDEETPGSGIFKVTGEHKLLAGLGNMKFNYEFGEDQLVTSKNNGENDFTPYKEYTDQYFYLSLGPSKAGYLYLYFIKK